MARNKPTPMPPTKEEFLAATKLQSGAALDGVSVVKKKLRDKFKIDATDAEIDAAVDAGGEEWTP